MPDAWASVADDASIDLVDDLITALSDIRVYVDGAAEVARSALLLAAGTVNDADGITQAAVQGFVAAIDNVAGDLLQNNAHAALHLNTHWDPDWTWDDWNLRRELPWKGTGLNGWLSELMGSAQDPSDIHAPRADEETSVGGLFLLAGATEEGDVSGIMAAVQALGMPLNWRYRFDKEAFKAQQSETRRAFHRLGPISGSSIVQKLMDIRPPGADVPLYQAGGSPYWFSPPVGHLVPGTADFVDALNTATGLLRPGLTPSDSVVRLAELFRRRVDLLDEISRRLERASVSLASTLVFLGSCSAIYLPPEEGGLPNLLQRAQNAEAAPDFGDRGIVAGVGILTTADNPANHVEAYLRLLGIRAEALASTATVRAQALSDTFDSYFSE
jgi:hypothetical protein